MSDNETIGKWNHFLEHRFPLRTPPPASPYVPMDKIKVESPTKTSVRRPLTGLPRNPSLPPGSAVGLGGAQGPVSFAALGKRLACDQLFMYPLLFFLITERGLKLE